MRNEESKGIRLGLGVGRLAEGLVVESPDDETESLLRATLAG